jgi:hypothetical protein
MLARLFSFFCILLYVVILQYKQMVSSCLWKTTNIVTYMPSDCRYAFMIVYIILVKNYKLRYIVFKAIRRGVTVHPLLTF